MKDKRFDHHQAATTERASEHQEVRDSVKALAAVFDTLPAGREKAVALTKLEESMFWANAAVARQD